jgi:hypothetical protein
MMICIAREERASSKFVIKKILQILKKNHDGEQRKKQKASTKRYGRNCRSGLMQRT